MSTCRVIVEQQPGSGAWNMAVDEALLEMASASEQPVVRLYQWEQATVSLGYFQSPDVIAGVPGLKSLPAVRRLSGGGAIVHHHEWTYSCVLPRWNRWAARPDQLYAMIHRPICQVLAARGAPADLRGAELKERQGLALCFLRGDPRDIVLDGQKVLGSAQRRRRAVLLQHGSLILKRSEYAPEIVGLFDLRPDFEGDDLAADLACAIACACGMDGRASELTADERLLAERLARSRYVALTG